MKKNKLWVAFIGLAMAFSVNAQDKLFLSKRDKTDLEQTKFTLEGFNTSTGAKTFFYEVGDYQTGYFPDYLSYVPASKKIVGIANDFTSKKLVVINPDNSTESAFELSQDDVWYEGLVVAGNDVFVVKYIYATDTEPSKYHLMSLDISAGTETFVYEFETSLSQIRGITYVPSTKQIVIVLGKSNTAVIYKVDTKEEVTFELDQIIGSDYEDVITAKGKVYLFKSTYDVVRASSKYHLVELDLVSKTENELHTFTKSAAWGANLAYLPETDDLFAQLSSGPTYLVQYNLTSGTEVKTTTLASDLDDFDYSNLIVVPEGIVTAVSDELVNGKSLSIYPNPAKDVLNLTKQVNSVKVYDLNSVLLLSTENTQSVDISALQNGLYIVNTDNQKQKIVVAK